MQSRAFGVVVLGLVALGFSYGCGVGGRTDPLLNRHEATTGNSNGGDASADLADESPCPASASAAPNRMTLCAFTVADPYISVSYINTDPSLVGEKFVIDWTAPGHTFPGNDLYPYTVPAVGASGQTGGLTLTLLGLAPGKTELVVARIRWLNANQRPYSVRRQLVNVPETFHLTSLQVADPYLYTSFSNQDSFLVGHKFVVDYSAANGHKFPGNTLYPFSVPAVGATGKTGGLTLSLLGIQPGSGTTVTATVHWTDGTITAPIVFTAGATDPLPPGPTLKSLAFTATDPNPTDIGGGHEWDVTATYSDGTTKNVSQEATWTSSVPAVATAKNCPAGTYRPCEMITSLAAGQTLISAKYGGLTAGPVQMTVGVSNTVVFAQGNTVLTQEPGLTTTSGACTALSVQIIRVGTEAFTSVTDPLTVNLYAADGTSTRDGQAFYSDSKCTSTPITSVVIAPGNTGAPIFFRDTRTTIASPYIYASSSLSPTTYAVAYKFAAQ